jgi:hypothetical protein
MEKTLRSPIGLLRIISTFVLLVIISTSSFSQTAPPQGINYQAIARDTAGNPISNATTLSVEFSIYDDMTSTTPVFNEIHPAVNTNIYGLFTLVIGGVNNTSFQTIDWTTNKFLAVTLSLGGASATLPRTQLMSVPYALYSKNSGDAWKLNGNTIVDSMFIGTLNNKDFIIKTNDTARVIVASTGKTGIGDASVTPTRTLDVHQSTDLGNGIPVAIIRNTAASNGALLELNAASGGDPATSDKYTGLLITEPTGRFIQGWTDNTTKVFEVGTGGKGFFADSVGIGTATPAAKLDVIGKLKITDGSEGTGKTLTSDANGLATWTTSGTGTVTSFNAGDLAPLFTSTVTNNSTTPNLSFTLSNANPYTVFGNTTGANAAPDYFTPILSSALFQNQGSTAKVLHGNGSGNPTWGFVDLANEITGMLPIANGGTATNTIGSAGSVAYSNGTNYNFTTVGTLGQMLISKGTGAPIWSSLTAQYPVKIDTSNGGATYTFSVLQNSQTDPGIVSAGNGFANMVWKTDALGNPSWRNDSSVSYTAGLGITFFGQTINSVWTQSGTNIFNNNSNFVGINTPTPTARFHVESAGNEDVIYAQSTGSGLGNAGRFLINNTSSGGYAVNAQSNGTSAAVYGFNNGNGGGGEFEIINPSNGSDALHAETNGTGIAVYGKSSGTGNAGHFEITNPSSSSEALFVTTQGDGAALYSSSYGDGSAGTFDISNTSSTSNAVIVTTDAGNNTAGISVSHTGSGTNDYGIYIANTGGGTNNTAGYFSASGATNNYAAIFANGSVGIGTATPSSQLHTTGTVRFQNLTGTGTRVVVSDANGNLSATTGVGSGIVTGTGTLNYLPKWTPNGSTLGNSLIFDNGTSIGIGTTTPTSLFQLKNVGSNVTGYFETNNASNSSATVYASTNGSGNAIMGVNTGTWNAIVGSSTGTQGKAGDFSITNSSNFSDAFTVTTNGTGKAGNFSIANSSNSSDVLSATTSGTGRAGNFTNTNSANNSETVYIGTNGANNSKALNILHTGAGITDYGSYISNTGGGTTNVAGYFTASGATNNYAAIFDSGSVGIGTTTPSAPLHLVYNTSTTNPGVIIKNSNTSNTAFTSISLVNDGGLTGGISLNSVANTFFSGSSGMNIGTNGPSNLQLGTNSLPRVTVDATGNVGVGTTTPASLFHSAGQIRTGIPLGGLGGAAATKGSILFYNAINTNTVTINSDTTSSSYTLTLPKSQGIANSILFNNGSGGLSWVLATAIGWSNMGNSGTNATVNFIGTTDSVAFVAKTNSNERLRITGAGNVGIGTASPANKLHVFGGSTILDPNSTTSPALIIKGNQSAIQHLDSAGVSKWFTGLRSDNGGATDNFAFVNTSATSVMVLTETGNVGIGTTTPGSSIEISGALTYTPSTTVISGSTSLTPGNNGFIKLNPSGAGFSITGFSSAGAAPGQMVIIENIGAANITIQTGTGVRLNLGISYTIGTLDTLTLIFDGNNWIEIGRSNN